MARFAAALDAAGLGLRAALSIARYDAAVPEPWRSAALHPRARSAVVIASGGRALWDAFVRAPECGTVADPLDAYTRRVTEAAAAELDTSFAQRRHPSGSKSRGMTPRMLGEAEHLVTTGERRPAGGAVALFAFERRGGVYADFVELGRLAGLGAPSRLRLLLHPTYGPWISLRALVLTGAQWEEGSPLAFDPCRDCPAPCAAASTHEAARRACVVGPEHVYGDAALAHHAHFSPGLRAR